MNNKIFFEAMQKSVWPLVLLLMWLLYLIGINHNGLWGHIGVPHIEPLFADIGAVLQAADCHRDGFDAYSINPCTKAGAVHVYGSVWLDLYKLGFEAKHQFVIGFVLDLIFILLAVWFVRPKSVIELVICIPIFFSPAISLAIERANNDLMIFLLILLSAVLIANKSRISNLIGWIAIFFASLLKIYPIVLAVATFFVYGKKLKEKLFALIVSSIILTIWVASYFDEITKIKTVMPTPVKFYTTGGNQIFEYVGLSRSNYQTVVFLAIIGLLSVFLSRKIKTFEIFELISRKNYIAFVFGLFILCFTYAANTNYDYRWVFFLLLLPYIFELRRMVGRSSFEFHLTTLSLICAVYIMWSEAFMGNHPFTFKRLYIQLHLGRFLLHFDWLQRFLKEISAWTLFSIMFSLLLKNVPLMRYSGTGK